MLKKTSSRNKLVKKWFEGENHIDYKNALGRKQQGSGVYILYKKGKPYYVGISTSSMRGRVRQHATKDRHKEKWDTFSFYQIRKRKYLKDIESLLLRYHKIGRAHV